MSASPRDRIALALDVDDPGDALDLARRCAPHAGTFKIGPALLLAGGPAWLIALRGLGRRLFFDLKLYDIPETVARTVREAKRKGADLLTVHVAGGSRMMRAAADAAAGSGHPVALIGVTVLTAFDQAQLEQEWELREPIPDRVVRWAKLARDSGLAGVVCSPLEIESVRAAVGSESLLVVPGIRSAGDRPDDQRRTMTASEAAARGADLLVIGRTVLRASDPAAALAALAAQVESP